jgi:hypothetical protein
MRATVTKSIQQQYREAVEKCAKADHYLVTVRCPEGVSQEDIGRIMQHWYAREGVGRMSHAMVTRCLILLSQSSGYSLSDLGA